MGTAALWTDDTARMLEAIIELSHIRGIEGVTATVRRAARELTGADGVTFILREGDRVFYADENAIGPLWKGRRFQAAECISGWAMIQRETVVIEDIYVDDRIPHEAYRPTFVKSLAMVPVRRDDPVAAIGAYWATRHRATDREIAILEALASASATAIHNAELLEDARRAARVREDFLTIASHEMRTPLTSLLLRVNTIERMVTKDITLDRSELTQRLGAIRESGWRMNALIDHLLEATQMMRGRLVLAQARMDLAKLVRGVVDRLGDAAQRAGCELYVTAPHSLFIDGDEERLGVVVSNLLSNAIKYGAGHPIDMTLEPIDVGARLAVRDRGIGIAAKDQSRIFDPFERAVSTKNYGGFGVGLWAARKMVEAHGGRIGVESEPGRGARFVVELRNTATAA